MIYLLYPQLFERHLLLINLLLDGGSNISRVLIWKNLLAQMDGVWLFGHGYGVKLDNYVPALNRTFATAHNLYIGHLYLGGLVGLILTLGSFIFVALSSLLSVRHTQNYLGPALFVFTMLVMTGQYTFLLNHPEEVWINILLPLSICYGLSITPRLTSNKQHSGECT
jgi:O-antigen ligase